MDARSLITGSGTVHCDYKCYAPGITVITLVLGYLRPMRVLSLHFSHCADSVCVVRCLPSSDTVPEFPT